MRSYSEKAKALAGPSREHRHSAQPGLASRPIAGAGHSFSRVSVTNQELPVIQRRLTVGAPGDAYEQEADRAAEVVTRKTALQAAGCSCATSGGPEKVCAECAATPPSIQRKASGGPSAATAPSIINEVIQQPGRPLDGAVDARDAGLPGRTSLLLTDLTITLPNETDGEELMLPKAFGLEHPVDVESFDRPFELPRLSGLDAAERVAEPVSFRMISRGRRLSSVEVPIICRRPLGIRLQR
jgi:hypothetical protein